LLKFHDENFGLQHTKNKCRLGPQNGSRSSGPKKLLKIVNYENCHKVVLSQLEKVGGHRYPLSSNIELNIDLWGWLNNEKMLVPVVEIVKIPSQKEKLLKAIKNPH
jgi:hypothetical protein